jgi:type III secretory pathway component EscS
MLMRSVVSDGAGSYPSFHFVLAAIAALLLCLGLFTPLCCIASVIGQIVMRLEQTDEDLLHLAFSLLVTVALFLLGPGAFSLDSRLFGRRLIVRSK